MQRNNGTVQYGDCRCRWCMWGMPRATSWDFKNIEPVMEQSTLTGTWMQRSWWHLSTSTLPTRKTFAAVVSYGLFSRHVTQSLNMNLNLMDSGIFFPKSEMDFGRIGICFVARLSLIFSNTDKSENNNKYLGSIYVYWHCHKWHTLLVIPDD